MKLTDFTVAERESMQKRYSAIRAKVVEAERANKQISEKDRDFLSSIAYQMHSKKCLSEKQLSHAERIVSKF